MEVSSNGGDDICGITLGEVTGKKHLITKLANK